jgi:hypothetical protein
MKEGAPVAVIKLPSGLEVTTFELPRDFDPQTANTDDLERFGFLPLPEDPQHLDRYKHMLSQLAGGLDYIQPTFQQNVELERFHGPRQGPSDPTGTSTNWSGGALYAPGGESIKVINGEWTIPHVSAPTEGRQYYAASWIGMDGDGSSDVLQAGVECEVHESGGTITQSIYPWWEWYPEPEVRITSVPVEPGHKMMVSIWTNPPGAGATEGKIFFTNKTTGVYTSFIVPVPKGTSFVGNCAEWIVGVPTVAGQLGPLANYGAVTFTQCEAFLTKGSKIVHPDTGIDMLAGGSVVSRGTVTLPPAPATVQCVYV